MRIGSRLSAQRSIGGIAMVVTIAMVTMRVNRFWLSTPIDRPMVATITSVEPRAFMPQPSASDSARVRPPSLPPTKAPRNLPMLAMTMRPNASSASSGFFSTVRSALRPARPKNTGMNSATMRPRKLLVDMAGEDRRFADQDAGDEGAEHGVDADQLRRSAPSRS